MEHLFLVVHGDYNKATELEDLTMEGRGQMLSLVRPLVERLGERRGVTLYHSPLRRGRESAEILQAGLSALDVTAFPHDLLRVDRRIATPYDDISTVLAGSTSQNVVLVTHKVLIEPFCVRYNVANWIKPITLPILRYGQAVHYKQGAPTYELLPKP